VTTTSTRTEHALTPSQLGGAKPLPSVFISLCFLAALYFLGGPLLKGPVAPPTAQIAVDISSFVVLLASLIWGEFTYRVRRLVSFLGELNRFARKVKSDAGNAVEAIQQHAQRETAWSATKVIGQVLIPSVCLGVGAFLSQWPNVTLMGLKRESIERYSLLLIFVVWVYLAFIYHNWMLIIARVERHVVNALREMAGEAKQQSRSDNSTNSGPKSEFGSRLLLYGILAVFSVMIAAEILLSRSTSPRPGYSAFGFQLGVYAVGLGLLSWLLITIRLWQEWRASSQINRIVSLVRR
jgi:hypothetical protein